MKNKLYNVAGKLFHMPRLPNQLLNEKWQESLGLGSTIMRITKGNDTYTNWLRSMRRMEASVVEKWSGMEENRACLVIFRGILFFFFYFILLVTV